MKAVGLLAILMSALAFTARAETPAYATGLMGSAPILMPQQPLTAVVFLLSGRDGWTDADDATAKALSSEGAAVISIDLRSYLSNIEKTTGACAYLVSDMEQVSHQIQRTLKSQVYLSPIVAGRNEGGTLALAIAAQTPAATIGRTVAVDALAALPLEKPLCTGAPREAVAAGVIYGLEKRGLPNPVEAVFTELGPADGRQHVADLRSAGFGLVTADEDGTSSEALLRRLDAVITQTPPAGSIDDLPVVELAAAPRYDAMAIVISGDGGWRDLDKTIADAFQAQGMPTVGLDALRYFWSEKTPEQTAKDLSRIVGAYTRKWRVSKILLVGYSFGADVLPAAMDHLPEDDRERVVQLSLLALSQRAGFEIRVSGWLGAVNEDGRPILPDIQKLDAAKIQCFYGEDDSADSLCPKLPHPAVEVIKTAGGHHFDGDYPALAQRILDGFHTRVAARTPQLNLSVSPNGAIKRR